MNVLDLFSGIGGFSLGLEATGGFRTVAFCEIEEYPRAVLRKHWPQVAQFSDVRELNIHELTGSGIGRPQVICGGFPCQDISVAGRGAGITGSRSGLWVEYRRLIKEIKPRWAIIENVSALRSRGLAEVLRSLAEIGYDAEWHCIPASSIGARHRRDRIWIVAHSRIDGRGRTRRICDLRELQEGKDRQGKTDQSNQPSQIQTAMAYIGCERSSGRGGAKDLACETGARQENSEERERYGYAADYSGSIIPDTDSERLSQRHVERSGSETRRRILSGSELERASATLRREQWQVEPNVGRVADGIPSRVDRLKALGNSIVPQIAKIIGQAILNYEAFNVRI